MNLWMPCHFHGGNDDSNSTIRRRVRGKESTGPSPDRAMGGTPIHIGLQSSAIAMEQVAIELHYRGK